MTAAGRQATRQRFDAPLAELMAEAAALRDSAHGRLISYSRKVFIPLTKLCRDVCHYCTFAEVPRAGKPVYLSPDEVLAIARAGAAAGCTEALFTLGDKPELRYQAARDALKALGHETTISYLTAMCALVLRETGLLPHANPGVMTREEIAGLREVTASQGIMLESTSERLCRQGGVHYGSPDKHPAVRLETLRLAGELKVPFTTGILIGIGETRDERIDALEAIRDLHAAHGHIQEVIVQNFRAKPDTKLANSEEPDLDDLLWTIATARLILGPDMNIQAPPNLSPGVYQKLIDAGLNDWGGISPVTPDHVNPEAPWPAIAELARKSADAGKLLVNRLPVYPAYVRAADTWLAPDIATRVRRMSDAEGFARDDDWAPGNTKPPPAPLVLARGVDAGIAGIVERATSGERLASNDIVRLFAARDADYRHVTQAADALRRAVSGDVVRYVVNRNINYTNICYFRCKFCAFSKGRTHEDLRGSPYDLAIEEITRRAIEAWDRGATEVCLQGGIHPDYTGATYEAICRAIKAVVPEMHIHAFSALEVTQGAATLGLPIPEFLAKLKAAGLGTLPGTAAEILDDEVRAIICPDKINTGQWLDVQRAAHQAGLRTTSTIMYGHVETSTFVGETSARATRLAGRNRRLHRVRAASLRPHGSADVPPRHGAPRPDVPRSRDHAFSRAAGPASADPQHPDIVGEDGAGGRRNLPEVRRQRSRWHADEREHLARRRHPARPGVSAARDGSAHPLDWPRTDATRHALSAGAGRPSSGIHDRGRPGADRADAAAQEGGGRLGDAPLGQQRGHAKFVEQRAGTRAG